MVSTFYVIKSTTYVHLEMGETKIKSHSLSYEDEIQQNESLP